MFRLFDISSTETVVDAWREKIQEMLENSILKNWKISNVLSPLIKFKNDSCLFTCSFFVLQFVFKLEKSSAQYIICVEECIRIIPLCFSLEKYWYNCFTFLSQILIEFPSAKSSQVSCRIYTFVCDCDSNTQRISLEVYVPWLTSHIRTAMKHTRGSDHEVLQ